jgi:hypothetical protein
MINFVDDLGYSRKWPKGVFSLKVLRSGIVIEEYESHNLVVNSAFFQMARLLAGDTAGRSVTKIGFGTNGTNPAVTDTTLADQYLRAVSGYEYPGDDRVKINWVLPVDENNGMRIAEFGLFCEDGTLFARKTRDGADPIPKAADISLEGRWTIIF